MYNIFQEKKLKLYNETFILLALWGKKDQKKKNNPLILCLKWNYEIDLKPDQKQGGIFHSKNLFCLFFYIWDYNAIIKTLHFAKGNFYESKIVLLQIYYPLLGENKPTSYKGS